MAAIHIGISGWRYTPWRGDFYPIGLTHKRELQFASRAVNSIEINGSFYALQRPERYAVEIRHDSFVDPLFVRLLKRYNTALVIADTAGKWPYREDITSDFVYLRLHGAEALYASGYTPQALKRWGERIEAWHHGQQPDNPQLIAPRQKPKACKSREVFCYFDNDIKVRAPFDARHLLQRLHLEKNLATVPGEPAAESLLP
ncbi:hypothetical protein AO361_06595 [Pseudomonas fluorescens]|uniref:DUF72 domain-containing protein n=1 Tax=Pseudomonas TaxID=286 RepID=UPI0007098C6A|nr:MULTISPECIES: DUF72 domain-containing protein [Pseudomonas]OOQ42849.1 hypothetical protein AO361_06595 [Pseudomonas fluorescens]